MQIQSSPSSQNYFAEIITDRKQAIGSHDQANNQMDH